MTADALMAVSETVPTMTEFVTDDAPVAARARALSAQVERLTGQALAVHARLRALQADAALGSGSSDLGATEEATCPSELDEWDPLYTPDQPVLRGRPGIADDVECDIYPREFIELRLPTERVWLRVDQAETIADELVLSAGRLDERPGGEYACDGLGYGRHVEALTAHNDANQTEVPAVSVSACRFVEFELASDGTPVRLTSSEARNLAAGLHRAVQALTTDILGTR